MIKLIDLPNPRAAQAFIDYMASRQIELRLTQENSTGFSLWLVNADDLIEAKAELKHFLADPGNAKYQQASWLMAESRTAKFHYKSTHFGTMIKAKAGPFTLGVMLLVIIVFLLQNFGYAQITFQWLHFPATSPQSWQVWRWLTHALLHFSAAHLIFNLLWWWQFGGDIEKRLGSGVLVKLFIVSAAVSGLGQYWIDGVNFGGLSGVVYALAGYLWMMSIRRPDLSLYMPKPLIIFMIIWLLLGYVQPFLSIANTAHLAGLVTGVVFGLLDSFLFRRPPTTD